ncbi:MAG: hypothetical protein SGBAC_013295 [Bacillariaceae sp.]
MTNKRVICLSLGYQFGYIDQLKQQVLLQISDLASIPSQQLLTALGASAATVMAQKRMNSRFTGYSRETNLAAIATFGIVNGVLETFAFLAVYEMGAGLLGDESASEESASKPIQTVAAFTILLVYLGLIHALFWAPKVFPEHIRTDAPPFHTHALPALFVITLAMMLPFVLFSDLTIPCLLHIYVDMEAAVTIKLPGPMSTKNSD